MMIRKYNVLSLPFFAFFSKRAYRDVGRNWKGANLAYLFVLMAVCTLPPTLALNKHIAKSLESTQAGLIKQLPDIQISNGHVIVQQHQPYYIKRNDGSTAIIIDTTGSMNYIDNPHVMALLTESSLIVRSGEHSFKTFDLAGITDFYLNRFIAQNWLQTARHAMVPLSYGILLLLSYVFAVAAMLLAAIFGLILSSVMHGKLSFAGALRVATVAATPSLVCIAIAAALGVGVRNEILLAVSLAYLIAGIKVSSSPLAMNEGHVDLKSCLHEEGIMEHAA